MNERTERIRQVLANHGVSLPSPDVFEALTQELSSIVFNDIIEDWQKAADVDDPLDIVETSMDKLTSLETIDDGSIYVIPGVGVMLPERTKYTRDDIASRWNDAVSEAKGDTVYSSAPDAGGFLFDEKTIVSILRGYSLLNKGDGNIDRSSFLFGRDKERRHEDNDCRLPHSACRQVDEFDIDVSRSRIHIGQVSSHPSEILNGSATAHQHYVTITITGPSGREICCVALSPAQFATAIMGSSESICTLQSYYSLNEYNVRMTEKVRPLVSVADRLKKRLKHRLGDNEKRMAEIMNSLTESIEAGKPLGKTKQAELLCEISMVSRDSTGNADFTIEQSVEEITGIVEAAALFMCDQTGIVDANHVLGGVGKTPRIEFDNE